MTNEEYDKYIVGKFLELKDKRGEGSAIYAISLAWVSTIREVLHEKKIYPRQSLNTNLKEALDELCLRLDQQVSQRSPYQGDLE